MGAGLMDKLGHTHTNLDGPFLLHLVADVCNNLHICINSLHSPCLCFCTFRS
jgi:hypothetical protein